MRDAKETRRTMLRAVWIFSSKMLQTKNPTFSWISLLLSGLKISIWLQIMQKTVSFTVGRFTAGKRFFLAKQENVSWQETDSGQENDSGQESDSGQEKGAGQQETGSWQENDSEHFALLVFKAPRCPSQVATSVGLPLFRGSFRHAASKRPWLDSWSCTSIADSVESAMSSPKLSSGPYAAQKENKQNSGKKNKAANSLIRQCRRPTRKFRLFD